MKLQNDQTGQVENFCIDKDQICSCDRAFVYDSLAQLQEAGWKDYEEPKDWGEYIISCGNNYIEPVCAGFSDKTIEKCNELGMLFETKEEAEKAVEKLKAWKRLKDKGFRITIRGCKGNAWLEANWGYLQGDYSDVLSLFGSE